MLRTVLINRGVPLGNLFGSELGFVPLIHEASGFLESVDVFRGHLGALQHAKYGPF